MIRDVEAEHLLLLREANRTRVFVDRHRGVRAGHRHLAFFLARAEQRELPLFLAAALCDDLGADAFEDLQEALASEAERFEPTGPDEGLDRLAVQTRVVDLAAEVIEGSEGPLVAARVDDLLDNALAHVTDGREAEPDGVIDRR